MRAFLALALGLAYSAAHAQSSELLTDTFYLLPAAASTRDVRYIGYRDFCGDHTPVETPVLRRESERRWILDVAWRVDVACFTLPPDFASTLHLVRLPDDVRDDEVVVRIHRDGMAVQEQRVEVRLGSFLPRSVNGVWHDASTPGQGMYFTRSTRGWIAGWTTYDGSGQPLWLTGQQRQPEFAAHRARLTLHSARGGRFPSLSSAHAPQIAVWGEVAVEYLGCDRLRVTWDAVDDAAFPAGAMELRKTVQDADYFCDFDQYGLDHYLSVRYYEPVLRP